jgi:hypothetical protein
MPLAGGTFSGAVTWGSDDTGYDVKLFGATSGAYLLWDESDDALKTAGGATIDVVKDKFKIGGSAVTTTAAELNILDGVTSTTAELNILDGVTSTATELNLLDGVTATTTELNYVDGVTSAIQTQLDAKGVGDVTLTGSQTLTNKTLTTPTITTPAITGIDLAGCLREGANVTAGKLSDNTNIDLEDGMVHLFTTAESTTCTPNIRFSSSTSLNTTMAVGEAITVTLITTANASGYSANITIDGSAVTENWIGGSAPDEGGSSGVDIHAFNIIKTASATFTVIGNHTKTS